MRGDRLTLIYSEKTSLKSLNLYEDELQNCNRLEVHDSIRGKAP